MRRRKFMMLAGSAVACPIGAAAQQQSVPAIGILQVGSSRGPNPGVTALLKGLGEAGYFDGRNVALDYRYAEGQAGLLPALAVGLARQRVAVIASLGGSAPALAAKAATTAIPIIFAAPQNPIEVGLIESLSQPGGNVTGIVGENDDLTARRMELLHELIPAATALAVLVNPNVPTAVDSTVSTASAVARARGVQLHVLKAASEGELQDVFAQFGERRASALLVGADVSFFSWRMQIVAMATRYRVPTTYWRRDFVVGGGLTSYGANFDDLYRQAGLYIGRVLKGEKPSNLPVLQPSKIDFAINLKTAGSLGINVPPRLLTLATEVIGQ